MGNSNDNKNPEDSFFLPDFCNVSMVFSVVIIGELLAFILVLSPMKDTQDRWGDLSIISLFIQWVALTSAAALCIARPYLQRLNEKLAATLSYVISLIITLVLTEASYWIMLTFNFRVSISPDFHLHLIAQNMAISAIVSAIVLRYFYVQHQWKRHIVAESRARFEALQARIRPHFLFNSMNTIASLTRSNPEKAEEAVEDLSDLFRQSLSDSRREITLEEELELTKRYLSIEKLRMGDRLQCNWHIDSLPQDALIPALSIQPLVENAIYHGIESLAQGGVITIDGQFDKDMVTITLTNPLPDTSSARQGNQIAQENILNRLEAIHGHKAKMEVNSGNGMYKINIRFPYRNQEEADQQ